MGFSTIDWEKWTGFDWDEGNSTKNWERHQVTPQECEEIFFNKPLLIHDDHLHSAIEQRYQALGHTSKGRRLCISFTLRGSLIRVISGRDQNRKEQRIYEETT